MGLPVGHWHVHLYFPTMTCEMIGGGTETLIKDGHLMALDDPEIRKIAAKYGDPDLLLSESWIPAVPGLNMTGDYWKHYAEDPEKWVLSELNICENYHPMFMSMVGADPKYCNNPLWKMPNISDTCSCGGHHLKKNSGKVRNFYAISHIRGLTPQIICNLVMI